jgi:hypothetical protein
MAAPRKIGVLTFHRCINYGSYWQARCLVEGLRGRGLDAVLLDHRSARVDRAEWRCALSPHLPAPTRPRHRAAYARKTRAFLAAIEALPLSPPFSLEAPDTIEDCDLVVVGSDEVWNRRHPWYGGAGLFYGWGLRARRLAAYAASFGNHAASDGLDGRLADQLRRFDAISVRDENSRRLIRDCLGREPELVLDPCLQFPEAIPRAPLDGAADVAVIYGHSFPGWFARGVRQWARGRGLRVVSLGYHADWADEERLDAGPEDFSRTIAEAAAVATTFFHGCVFALVHGKPFACAASPYRSNKLQSLVATLRAEGRLLGAANGPADYRAALDVAPDEGLARRLAALRSRSAAYLDHALH